MKTAPHTRRDLLRTWPLWLGAGVLSSQVHAAASEEALARLRRGGVVVLLRHATTDPGVGDPPGFRAGECSTQRNLSTEGRAQARRIGRWWAARQLQPAAVRSSAWCRCLDTATLAFGSVQHWPALDSFFADAGTRQAQTAQLRAALAALRPGGFEVWVTHLGNISALSGEGVGMGEALLVEGDGAAPAGVQVRARLSFDD